MGNSFQISVQHLRKTLQAVLPHRRDRVRRTPTVLVVDDEPLIVQGLAAILDREGFTVLTAFDAQSALKLVQKTSPELLISDVNMPGMDGIELAMRLVTALPTLKVLLFSADSESLKVNFQPQEGYHFSLLAKPVPPQQMLDRVRATLQGIVPARVPKPHDSLEESAGLVQASQSRQSRISPLATFPDLQAVPVAKRLNGKRHFLKIQ